MDFEIIGKMRGAETFAKGASIRALPRLTKGYGRGHWRKRKAFATVKLSNGAVLEAEVHW
jgi:hypothetical protein